MGDRPRNLDRGGQQKGKKRGRKPDLAPIGRARREDIASLTTIQPDWDDGMMVEKRLRVPCALETKL